MKFLQYVLLMLRTFHSGYVYATTFLLISLHCNAWDTSPPRHLRHHIRALPMTQTPRGCWRHAKNRPLNKKKVRKCFYHIEKRVSAVETPHVITNWAALVQTKPWNYAHTCIWMGHLVTQHTFSTFYYHGVGGNRCQHSSRIKNEVIHLEIIQCRERTNTNGCVLRPF